MMQAIRFKLYRLASLHLALEYDDKEKAHRRYKGDNEGGKIISTSISGVLDISTRKRCFLLLY